MPLRLYQTLQDKNNPEYVEKNGPFWCRRPTAWLGEGYYFWDSHIELGHWWGKTSYGTNYIICRAYATMDGSCWDLHGNGEHREDFERTCEILVKKGVANRDNMLVPQVITFLVRSGKWPFKAIRALAVESINYNQNPHFVVFRRKFHAKNKSFLDLRPPVQLCLLNRTALSLKEYSIVHPEHYVDYEYA